MASTSEMSKSKIDKNTIIDNHIFLKAKTIHLKLLSLVINELNKNKKIAQNFQIYSLNGNKEINNENKDRRYINGKHEIIIENQANISYESEENEEESSSDMSCCEECIINMEK